jgi:hypothetical protein
MTIPMQAIRMFFGRVSVSESRLIDVAVPSAGSARMMILRTSEALIPRCMKEKAASKTRAANRDLFDLVRERREAAWRAESYSDKCQRKDDVPYP